jgi:hypothetical protein
MRVDVCGAIRLMHKDELLVRGSGNNLISSKQSTPACNTSTHHSSLAGNTTAKTRSERKSSRKQMRRATQPNHPSVKARIALNPATPVPWRHLLNFLMRTDTKQDRRTSPFRHPSERAGVVPNPARAVLLNHRLKVLTRTKE